MSTTQKVTQYHHHHRRQHHYFITNYTAHTFTHTVEKYTRENLHKKQ